MLELRSYQAEDAREILRWTKGEYAFRQWCADRFAKYPIDETIFQQYYDEMARRGERFWPITAVHPDKGIVGHFMIRTVNQENHVLRFGFVIVNDALRGCGMGKEMLKKGLVYTFQRLGAKKVTLGVFENNRPALECYLSVGFTPIPNMDTIHYCIMGETWGCIEMEIALPE